MIKVVAVVMLLWHCVVIWRESFHRPRSSFHKPRMKSNTAQIALLSWCLDVLASATVIVLLVSWVYSVRSPTNPILSQSFIDNGFCLSPLFDNTHLSCSKFDAFCGIACVLGMIITKKSSLGGMSAYFLSHAYGHYDVGVSVVDEGFLHEENIEVKNMIVLAAILSIGPLTAASDLVKAQKMSKATGNICAFLGLTMGVFVYGVFIKRPCYALLYINIFIILANSLPKSFLIGYTSQQDVEIRASKFRLSKAVSGLVVLAVVFSEPFFCDSFVKHIGGHALFDLVLAMDTFAHFVSVAHEELVQIENIATKLD
jgi:hypothetical protein